MFPFDYDRDYLQPELVLCEWSLDPLRRRLKRRNEK